MLNCKSYEEVLDYLVEVIKIVGYIFVIKGKNVIVIVLDVVCSEFYDEKIKKYIFKKFK